MVRDVIVYPRPLSLEFGISVRTFDEKLSALIDDLRDTINEGNYPGLSAFQIGSYFNVIVVRGEDGELIEMVNPKLISHNGSVISKESTAYFPGLSAQVKRYQSISVVYQDRNGEKHVLKASDELAVTIQRKLDYTFGSTFLTKLSKEEKQRFENSLEFGTDVGYESYCPTSFVKDKIMKFLNIMVVGLLVMLLVSFFVSKEAAASIWSYQLYLSYFVVFMNVVYIGYGKYESAKYKTCTSCQIGNLLGSSAINLIKLSIVMVLSYLLI